MNFPLHCQAFYAQWIVRYLHPRRAPWKIVADKWLSDGLLGRSVLLVNAHDNSGVEDVPDCCAWVPLARWIETDPVPTQSRQAHPYGGPAYPLPSCAFNGCLDFHAPPRNRTPVPRTTRNL